MTNIMELNEHCRLCLVKDEVNIPIFEDEGDVRQVLLKITACLPVKIAKADSLPKRICDGCLYKLESFYQFWNTSVNSEKQLLQWLAETLNGDAEANLHALKQEPTDNLQTESQVYIQQQLAYQETENYGGYPEETTNYKPKKTSTKKERDREKRERERERKREEAEAEEEEEEEAPAPKRKRRAATKKPAIEIDDDDDDDEYIPPAAISKTEDDSDANDDPGDDYGGDDNASDDNADDDTEPGPSGTTKSTSDAPKDRGGRLYVVNGDEVFVKNTQPFTCEICNRTVARFRSLCRHVLSHYDDPIACKICGKVQRSLPMYENHMLYHKNKQKERDRVACQVCGKLVYDIKAHMKSHKKDREVFPCDQCDKKYLSKIFLANHQSSVHLNVRYQCDQCDKSFRTKTYYIDHIETHEKAIKCDKCNSSFTNKVSFRRHLRKCVQEQPPQMCDICGKALSSTETLRKHKITHTGERPYKCSLCPLAFAQRGTRDDHVRTHTNERPHTCPICGKSFIQRTACRVHINSHNRQHKPSSHLCCICNKTLPTAGQLKLHIKSHGAEMLS